MELWIKDMQEDKARTVARHGQSQSYAHKDLQSSLMQSDHQLKVSIIKEIILEIMNFFLSNL